MKHDAEKYVPVKDRMPAPQTDAELDEISPAARKAMEQKREDVKQEKKQKKMENTVYKAKGGSVKSSASKRGDGIAQRGKTKGRMV
jgi:hypothetical protein